MCSCVMCVRVLVLTSHLAATVITGTSSPLLVIVVPASHLAATVITDFNFLPTTSTMPKSPKKTPARAAKKGA